MWNLVMSSDRQRARRENERTPPGEQRKLILLGASRNSADILDVVDAINRTPGRQTYECLSLLDDKESLWGTTIAGRRVLGSLASARECSEAWFVNGIGSPSSFWKKDEIIARSGVPLERFATLVHPAASVSATSEVGPGTVIFQNVTIGSGARIGKHVLICPGAVVSHDCIVGDYTCIASSVSIAGDVRVGSLCYLGMSCAVRERVEIGNGSLLGMGSVVLRNVAENSVVVGNPARYLRVRDLSERNDGQA